eukprot:3227599-Rhodomonas_salina.3
MSGGGRRGERGRKTSDFAKINGHENEPGCNRPEEKGKLYHQPLEKTNSTTATRQHTRLQHLRTPPKL